MELNKYNKFAVESFLPVTHNPFAKNVSNIYIYVFFLRLKTFSSWRHANLFILKQWQQYQCQVLIQMRRFLSEICSHFLRLSNILECQPGPLIQRFHIAYCISLLILVSCVILELHEVVHLILVHGKLQFLANPNHSYSWKKFFYYLKFCKEKIKENPTQLMRESHHWDCVSILHI